MAFHTPQLRLMRDAIVLATVWTNDVYSLEKEEADGDVDNIVLVLEKAQHYTRKEAVDHVVAMVKREVLLFEQLSLVL
ncbi:terpene synthase family protein [Streptomyces sp. NPDC001584]|uniref:terpene synthase family protein n=1 Tax=Streptomyces sp. NPDC001584 TaxID=3154521 RepID=UPI0033302F38